MPPSLTTLHVGDLHIADTPPARRLPTYRADILDKLAWVMAEANRRDVDLILIAGDVFHHKRSVSVGLLADTYDVLSIATAPKLILPGNHDVVDNRMEDVERRPIGLLGRMPGVDLALTGHVLAGPLAIQPVPYAHEMAYERCRFSGAPQATWRLLWVHYGVTPAEKPYHTLVTSDPRWDVGAADVVFSGHIHEDLGAHRDRHGVPCLNLGALSRGSLTVDNLERQPRVLLTEWPGDRKTPPRFEPILVPCRPAADVFDLRAKLEELDDERVAAAFLERLGQTSVSLLSPEEVEARIREMREVPEGIRAKAVQALQEAWG